MPYAFGTQNAPAVGNGLGGLPRRSITVASTVKQIPVKLQAIGSALSVAANTSINLRSMPVPVGKNLGAFLYSDSATTYTVAKGFRYDPNVGITGFASNSTALAGNALANNAFAFAGGMLYFTNTTGEFYRATTNGTTTTRSTFVTIPSSGTLDDSSSYISLTDSNSFGSSNNKNTVCFDLYGNMVVLYLLYISTSWWLAAFVINTGGTILTKRRLIQLNSTTNARDINTDFWIARSGTGFILAGSSRSTTGYMNMWNVSSDFTTVTAVGPTNAYSPTGGGTPQNSTFFLSSNTAAIITNNSDGYGNIWGVNLNSSGVAVAPGANSARIVYPYYQTHAYNVPEFYDPVNNLYTGSYTVIGSFQTGPYDPAYIGGMANVWTPTGAVSDSNMGVANLNLYAAAAADIDLNGINYQQLGYMGDGYWVLVYGVSTINTWNAKLYKEV